VPEQASYYPLATGPDIAPSGPTRVGLIGVCLKGSDKHNLGMFHKEVEL
jgi:hypothetical protein